jgi:carbohydrate-binding DOMON domain-containing protein
MLRRVRFQFLLTCAALLFASLAVSTAAIAQVSISDPTGDDNGPGSYVYPTDAVYTAGSFDLTGLKLEVKGKRAVVEVSIAGTLADPWGMGVGFATQMVFVFIDNKEGGHTDAPPGLNVKFAADSAWDKVIILSPQPRARVLQEVEAKAGGMAADIVVPQRTTGAGNTITGQVKLEELGEGDPAGWGYQVVMQSNEGFPSEGDLLTRKVNEFEGQHRFGGGTDYDCDPHVIDILGDSSQLQYECAADGSATKMATLSHVKAQ